MLKFSINECGYVIVILYKNNRQRCFRVSRLVAKAFIPNPLKLRTVNHKKGNKLDNRAWQLEWMTHAENMQHAVKLGLQRGSIKIKKAS